MRGWHLIEIFFFFSFLFTKHPNPFLPLLLIKQSTFTRHFDKTFSDGAADYARTINYDWPIKTSEFLSERDV